MTLTAVVRAIFLTSALAASAAGAALAADAKPTIVPAGKNDKGHATGDMVLGKADAPLTLVEYASLTCPHCAMFHAQELPGLKANYIETGKLRLVFREFPLDGFALRGAMLARCAGPDRYFTFLDLLFKGQSIWAAKPKDGADPLAELRRLYAKSREHFAIYRSLMPTRLDPAGTFDRAVLDAAVAKARAGST